MTATATFTGPATRSAANAATAIKSAWKTGVTAGLTASLATAGTAAVAHALDVSLEVGGKAIPVVGFAQLTFVFSLVGTILAVVMARRANRPQHTFVVTTIALTVLSIVPDVLADAQTSTRFTLALTHVVAAAIVIPALASRLSH